MNWRLDYTLAPAATDSRLVSAWGFAQLRRSLLSQGVDVLTFTHGGQRLDTAPLLNYDGLVQLHQLADDGSATGWFSGRLRRLPASESGPDAAHHYEVKGPWVHLEELIYQQTWKQPGPIVSGVQTYTSFYSSHLYLGQNLIPHPTIAGAYATVRVGIRGQIAAALDYLLAQALLEATPFAPFTYDVSALPDFVIPLDEVRDLTVAEVVQKQLRWVPDAVTWFDYTESPPKLYAARRGDLATATVALT